MSPKAEQPNVSELLRQLGEKLTDPTAAKSIYTYKPHAKQKKFHESRAIGRLYIGGNRAGKTVGGAVEAVRNATGQNPNDPYVPVPSRGRIVAVDFKYGVEKIVKPEVAAWLPPSFLINGSWEDSYNRDLKTLTLANGSFIEFMSYEQETAKFAGTSRHWTWFDEEPPEDIFNECMLRLVDTRGRWWATMTPVEGMTWVYNRIYEGNDPNIDIIELASDENPYLSQEALDVVFAGMTKEEVEARRLGKFVQLGGLVYPMFDEEVHVLPEPLDLSLYPHGEIYASLDHGFRNPTAWLWHLVLPDSRIITFDELYESEQLIDWFAAQVHARDKTHGRTPILYVGDPSISRVEALSGTSIQTEYAQRGIGIMLGNNDVSTGINRVAMYLRAKRWFVTPNCVNTIREIKKYRWRVWANKKLATQNNPHETPHKKDDHAMDSLRYFMMLQAPIPQDQMPQQNNPMGNFLQAPTAVEPFPTAENPWAGRNFDLYAELARSHTQTDWELESWN